MDTYSKIAYLIQCIIKHDKEAIDLFHEKYHRLIYKCMRDIAKKYYPGANEFELQHILKEAYVEVLIKLLSNIHKIREKEEPVLRAYIWQVTKTTFIDLLKNRKKERDIQEKTVAYQDNPAICFSDLDDDYGYSVWDKEAAHQLLKEILERSFLQQGENSARYDLYQAIENHLEGQERLVINYLLSGFTEEETARLMRVNRSKVHSIKEEAISKLKASFVEQRGR